MNMPPPMSVTTYNDIINTIHNNYMEVANKSMQDAAQDIRQQELKDEYSEDAIVNIDISADGTWQRRGYASLNGAVTIIGINNGKCLAFEALSKVCKACQTWESLKGYDSYEEFMQTHKCPINHEGSAGSMEASGVLQCFRRSIETNKVRYTKYIGDGDTKAFPDIVKADPYPALTIVKGECIGHAQKRVGTRLRNLKKNNGKENSLRDGKQLGGTGRLTDKVINKLQNYFGIAIRQNTHDLLEMKKAVGAVVYHCSDASNSEARHMFCNKMPGTWCKYHESKINGTNYTEKYGLPKVMDLSKDELLQKCLHGSTQNNNESINGVIWKRHLKMFL